jgi:hypothetical protein
MLARLGVYLALTVVLQVLSGTYSSELSHFPDEPAHVLATLMIRDYVASGFHAPPMQYAENYYLHYPKVALGMWPPLYYTMAALWTLVVGCNRTTLLLYAALQAALLALALYLLARRIFNEQISFLLGIVLLCIPLVQYGASMFMLDDAVSAWEILALVLLTRYFDHPDSKWAAALFGLCTALGMLIKGNANYLVFVPPVLILLTGNWAILRKPGLYIAALIVLLLGIPWQVLTFLLLKSALPMFVMTPAFVWSRVSGYFLILRDSLGAPIFAFALLGVAVELIDVIRHRRVRTDKRSITVLGAMALLFAIFGIQSPAPFVGPEERYMTAEMPLLLLFSVIGIYWIAERLPGKTISVSRKVAGIAFVLLVTFALQTWRIPPRPPLGFRAAVDRLIKDPAEVILVISDSFGEGAAIGEYALKDVRPQHIILRGSKVMSVNPWDPTVYKPLLHNAEEVKNFLDSIPVDAVIIDNSQALWPQDRAKVEEVIQAEGSKWRLAGEIQPHGTVRHITFYTRLDSGQRKKGTFRLQMPYTLGHDLEYLPQ